MDKVCYRIGVFWVLLCLSLLGGCDSGEEISTAAEAVSIPEKEQQGVIIALGDSLTAGLGVELQHSYPALLQKKLEDAGYFFKVVNAGVSGETSSGTLSRLNWILSRDPDIVILEIGANDGLRGIDTELVEKNIEEIILTLRDRGVITVLAGMQMVWNLGEDYTERFNRLYGTLAEKYDLVFMPFFLKDVATVASLNRADGIHPNEKGYEIITANIYPYVVEAIERWKETEPAESTL
ncbi:MAG: arylesterase [Desulfopila sp.]|jgi:acyl-CoA thioesterase-1|nr:arylesterase [Desulfopila sp.]